MPAGNGRGFGRWWRGCFNGGIGRGRQGRPEQCICTTCGHVIPKQPGSPCFLTPCPKCGARMARKFESDR